MLRFYKLARTWLGLYVAGSESYLHAVMHTFYDSDDKEKTSGERDEGRRLVMEVSKGLTVVTFHSFVEHMNRDDSLGKVRLNNYY